MNLKVANFPFSIKSINHIFRQIYKKKSPLRLFHNFFLMDITINGKVIDLGSGSHSSYYNFLKLKNTDIYYADKSEPKTNKHYQLDLEKKLSFKDNEFDTVILFNVIEHIENHKELIEESFRILKKKGKLELFVPFMFRYHEDPNDFFRPTHFYIAKILETAGFKVDIHLIGTGPIKVISEIVLKYFKFNFLKTIIFIIMLLLDKLINFFSKDYKNYYCGIHCSCEKI